MKAKRKKSSPSSTPANPFERLGGDDIEAGYLKLCAEWHVARAEQRLHWVQGDLESAWDSHPNLDILPAGPSSRRAPDLVARGLEAMVDEATREYSMVVIDSPPFLNFAEPLRMSTIVDGVLLVTVAGQTDRQAVASVVATLKRVRANVVGLVLNKVTKDLIEHYHYYGYYGYYGKNYASYYSENGRS